MESAQIETPKPSETYFSFTRRRSPLKSETYYTLARILSHCYDKSHSSHAAQFAPQELNPDHGSDEVARATGKEECESVELIGPDRMECQNLATRKEAVSDESCEAIGAEDGGVFGDAQHVVIDIERILAIEESEDVLEPMDVMFDESDEGTGFQDKRCCMEKMLMDELEHIMKGDEVLDENVIGEVLDPRGSGKDNSLSLKTTSLCGEHKMQQADMEVEKSVSSGWVMDFPIPIAENAETEEGECSNQKISEAPSVSLDKEMTGEPPKPRENMEEESLLPKTNSTKRELEKSVGNSDSLESPNHMAEGGDIEEGEISGDYGTYDMSLDMPVEDAMVSKEKNVDEMQVSPDIFDKKEFLNDDQNGANKKSFEFTSLKVDTHDNANTSREVGPEISNGNKMASRPEAVVHEKYMRAKKAYREDLLLKDGGTKEAAGWPPACPNNLDLHGQISEKNTTGSHGITSTEVQDASSCKKKKRSLSKESKAKKKHKERKKRAEKNRELGVKRLKLHPVSKPKTVTYCRHYLKGRCRQGDKCQFSHDTVPLTKSTPCCHFARHSCMKGDACPFDHQLFKYPCDNFVKGFCSRGDACMFSHKIPTTEDSRTASNDCKPELKYPSLPGNTNIKMQLNVTSSSLQSVDALSNSVGAHPHTNVKTLVKPPALVPKGISRILTAEKSAAVNSTMLKQGRSSPSGNEGAKVGNQAVPSISDTFQKMDETPKRTSPCVVPKGINFLSFGKGPLDDSVTKKVASLHSNRGSGTKLTLADNLNLQKQASSSPNIDVSIKVGNQTSPSASKTTQNLNEMPKKTQPEGTRQGMNFLSLGNTSVDHSSSKRKASFPSSCDTGIDGAVLEGQTAGVKSQNSSVFSLRLPASPLASGQSSDGLASVKYKDAPNSAQKAHSLILFATKYESKMKMNRSVGALDVGKEGTSNITRSSQNDLAKASKILDFLSSGGSKK
ncbi:zinc finger CCCH domain-containing protein 7 isoform X2 [Corylus avellana]|uniref:zinc finger CCCH domain-containing protein 7 isoform X2 n=1 Tax=Corylus avellana TaxID=13451 RepID=UPI00286CCB23|nr:zinc finger CCCH domain-containing protein 7 isoform X2 [Corylus avellana]